MHLTEIIATIKRHVTDLRAEGVEHLAVFGSRARGDERGDSDLDVLIDIVPDRSFSLLNVSGVGLLLEDATGLQVQVTTRCSLSARLAERIADDLVPVF